MALELVRPYFRSRINALEFKEWKDGFASNNIPQTIIDRSYHLRHGTVSKRLSSSTDIVYVIPITVNAFFKGYKDVSSGIDRAMAGAEAIINDCVYIPNYVNPIKIVEFVGFTVEPYDEIKNDNIIRAVIDFNVIAPVCIDA